MRNTSGTESSLSTSHVKRHDGRSMTATDLHFWLAERTLEDGDCVIWKGRTLTPTGSPIGYLESKRMMIRRLVYESTGGKKIPARRLMITTCGNNRCVRFEHLKAATRAECNQRNWDQGRVNRKVHSEIATRNARVYNTRITMDDARTIRARHANGESNVNIARDYGIDQSSVYKIVHHKRWVDAGPYAQLMGK